MTPSAPLSDRRQRWQIAGLCLALATLLTACEPASHIPPRTPDSAQLQSCTVTRVSDGDTVRLDCPATPGQHNLRLRLLGIDAPELHQPYGREAREALQQLCLNQRVRIPIQPKLDRYGRALVELTCRNTNVALQMVRNGQAWVYRPTAKKYPHLVSAEQQARRERIGLWASAHPQPPWEWRKHKHVQH